MAKLILKRILQMIPTLLIVVTITFCLTRMLPGDPAVAILELKPQMRTSPTCGRR